MYNLEYLEKVKNENVDYKVVKEVGEHEIEYRKMKALEIIAEELCKYTIREENKQDDGYCEQSHDHTG